MVDPFRRGWGPVLLYGRRRANVEPATRAHPGRMAGERAWEPSPLSGIASPKGGEASPRARIASPRAREASPSPRIASPRVERPSPTRFPPSRAAGAAILFEKPASPRGGEAIFAGGEGVPAIGGPSPSFGEAPPPFGEASQPFGEAFPAFREAIREPLWRETCCAAGWTMAGSKWQSPPVVRGPALYRQFIGNPSAIHEPFASAPREPDGQLSTSPSASRATCCKLPRVFVGGSLPRCRRR
jgi:hypothetical protein